MLPKQLPFDQAEYDRRLLMARTAMAIAGLDALFVSDPSNMVWLTGYDAWTFNAHQGVIILQDADPIWWGRALDCAGAIGTVWMPDGCVIGYSASADQHPMEDLARHLDGLGVQNLGIEMDSHHFSAKAFSVLLQLLPGIGFADATNMVNLHRLIKSAPEIAFMRKAAAISVKVIGGLGARVELGASMNDVLAEVYRDAIRGVDGASGDYPAVAPSLGYGADRSTWEDRPLAAGDVASAQISGCFRRYHAPLCRSMILGPKSDDLRRTEAALIGALDAGIDVARSGNKASDIAKAMAGTGLETEGAFGYPIGVGYPPDWDEGAISIGFDDHSVLEPNMTFHISPRVILDGQRIAISESIRIRSDGAAEIFCDCPREIICKL